MELISESTFLYYVGIFSFIYILIKISFKFYTSYVLYFTDPVLDCRRLGRWALVTGSTDGIGKGIARELAKLGIKIVLVSRNPEKLKKVAEEIEKDFHVEVKCVTFDFTTDDVISDTFSVYDVIRDTIEGLEIGILVNNVGMLPDINRYLSCFKRKGDSDKHNTDLVNCNMTSMAKMTEHILPQMVKRGKGLVINLSSGSASFTVPTFALYGATKRFNDAFSKALSYEYEDSGVVIQSFQPFYVATNMTKAKPSFFIPTYTRFTSHLMKTIGKDRMCRGYWSHTLLRWIFEIVPEILMAKTMLFGVKPQENKKKVEDHVEKAM